MAKYAAARFEPKGVDSTDWVKEGLPSFCLWGQFVAQSGFWMALRCNRCGQEEPHGGDSWCLACTAHEAINGELRSAWGTPGSRSLASDLLVGVTRHIRALRRLGIAGAGKGRPALPEGAGPRAPSKPAERSVSRAPAAPAAPPPPPPPGPEGRGHSKDQVSVKREERSCDASYSEGEESESVAEDQTVAPEASGLKPAPKSAPRTSHERSEIPRRRTSERSDRREERGAGHSRAASKDRRSRREDREVRQEESRRRRSRTRERRDSNRHHNEGGSKRRKRCRPGHRGGGKHQRLYRAAQDPFKRLHYKKPPEFWDERPGLH